MVIKGFFITLALSTMALGLQAQSVESNVTKVDSKIAIVNGVEITKEQLDRQVALLLPRSSYHATVTDEKLEEVSKEALDELIEKEYYLTYAINRGYKVTQDELDEKLTEIKKMFKNQANFDAALKRASLTPDEFMRELKRDLIIQKLYLREIKSEVGEEELKKYYEQNKFKFMMPEKISVRLIYARNDPRVADGKKLARQKIDKAMEEIGARTKKLQDLNISVDTNKSINVFADVAAEFSDAMSRIKGGDMGFIHKGMLESDVEDVAYSLKVGEMSDILESVKGYYIIKVEDKSPEQQLDFDFVKRSLKKDLTKRYEKEKKRAILDEGKKETAVERFGIYKI